MIVPRKWDQETYSKTAFHTRQFVTGTCRSDFLGQLTSPKSLIRVRRALCFGERREELHFIKSLWKVIIRSWNWLLKKFSFRALPPFELKIYSSRNIPVEKREHLANPPPKIALCNNWCHYCAALRAQTTVSPNTSISPPTPLNPPHTLTAPPYPHRPPPYPHPPKKGRLKTT